MRAIRLAITSAKGGVGKSTLAINLAGYLAKEQGCRVLLIDTDSQSSTSQFFLPPEDVDYLSTAQTIAAIYDESYMADPDDVVHRTSFENLDFIPASDRLEKFNLPEPHKAGEIQFALREFLKEVEGNYQFIIMDTPPLMASLQTWGCLLAADFALTPLVMETFAIQAIAKVDRMITGASRQNPNLSFLGYVVNMRNKNRSIQNATEDTLRAVHGERVFRSVINNLTAFSEAQAMRQPITDYARSGTAVAVTQLLCQEILGRVQKQLETRNEKAKNRRAA